MLRFATIMMSLLLFSFIVAISVNIKRERNLDCSCFGVLKKRPLGKTLLIQDCVLLGVAIFISITHTWVQIEAWSIFRLIGVKDDTFGFIAAASIAIILCLILFLRRCFSQKNIPFSREKLSARF
jgi:hypothetical protein